MYNLAETTLNQGDCCQKLFIMKKLLFSFALALTAVCAYSQVRIDWQQCYGTFGHDKANRIVKKEGGFWVSGYVGNSSGMVTIPVSNHSWVIGIDETGDLENEFSLGPYARMDEDLFGGISEGAYALGHPQNALGKEQLGIKKLDANGGVVWESMVGCPNEAFANSVHGTSTPDGGMIATTSVQWSGGDITNHYGLDDVWVVKTDSLGRLEWETTLGTENREWPSCIVNASDGGYYVAMNGNPGTMGSIPVCQVPSTDASDVLLTKLDIDGNLLWSHCYGGSNLDWMDHVLELEDGFLLICDTQSDDGDAEGAGYHLGYIETNRTLDIWLIRTDFDGNIAWSRCYGGAGSDFPIKAFHNEDGGFTVFGFTSSNDGDVQSAQNLQVPGDYHVYARLWVFRTDGDGNLLWERAIGTKQSDVILEDVVKLSHTEYIILATGEPPAEGFEGDFSCTNWDNHLCELESYWILHITDIYNDIEEIKIEETSVSLHPNPTNGFVHIEAEDVKEIQVFNQLGQCLKTAQDTNEVCLEGLPQGLYLLRVTLEDGNVFSDKVVKE